MFERIVELRGRHRPGVEPRVENGLDPIRGPVVALRTWDGHIIDVGAVQVHAGEVAPGKLRELLGRAHARVVLAVVASPDGNRRAPVTVARERPVDVVLEPVAETAVLDVFGVPVDGLVLREEVGLVRRRAREPGGLGPVDEGRVAAPAVWIGVRVVDDGDDLSARGEVVDEVGIGVLDETSRVQLAYDRLEAGRVVHRIDDRETFAFTDLAVDLAERRGEVHDAGTVVDGDEVVGDDREGALPVDGEHRERWFVMRADQGGRRDVGDDLGVGAEHVGDARPRHHEIAAAFRCADAHVVDRGSDCGPDVRRQGPRSGRPDEEIARAEVVVAIDEREPYVDRRFGDISVRAGLAELVARQGSAAPSAIRDDLVALVDRAVVPDLGEQRPDALDVVVGERPVRTCGVEPHADPGCERLPVLDVTLHRRPALGVEALDAVVLDL